MSEVPLYPRVSQADSAFATHAYLAYKKTHPTRTLPCA